LEKIWLIVYQIVLELKIKKNEGIIPRGLYLETLNRAKTKGVIVVGMNPGRINNDSQEYKNLLKDKISYYNYVKAFEKNILYKHPYFKRTHEVLEILKFTGPILWTEIVKCQSEENGKLSYDTIRNCVHKFLKKEVELVDYPIFALGDKAYNTCLLLFPERKIIDSQHPPGANSNFYNFLKLIKKHQLILRTKINNLKSNGTICLKDALIDINKL